jgi:hypothetical protein
VAQEHHEHADITWRETAGGWRIVIVAIIGWAPGSPPPVGLRFEVLTCDTCGLIARPLWYLPEARTFLCGTCPVPARPA